MAIPIIESGQCVMPSHKPIPGEPAGGAGNPTERRQTAVSDSSNAPHKATGHNFGYDTNRTHYHLAPSIPRAT